MNYYTIYRSKRSNASYRNDYSAIAEEFIPTVIEDTIKKICAKGLDKDEDSRAGLSAEAYILELARCYLSCAWHPESEKNKFHVDELNFSHNSIVSLSTLRERVFENLELIEEALKYYSISSYVSISELTKTSTLLKFEHIAGCYLIQMSFISIAKQFFEEHRDELLGGLDEQNETTDKE